MKIGKAADLIGSNVNLNARFQVTFWPCYTRTSNQQKTASL